MHFFIEKRKIFYILSILILIPGLVSLCTKGLNTGIDFKGGTIIQAKISSKATPADVREVLKGQKLEKSEVTKSGSVYFIRTDELNEKEIKAVNNALIDRFKNVKIERSDSVGATIGKELTQKALLAVLIAALAMLIYITFRFEWKFGVAAVIAEAHDILLVIGLFSLFQWEINSPFIAALLTIVGYSINDTIVIFDRIRENLKMKRKENHADLVNRSIMQSLNRSINTVLTCVFALVAMMIFGGINLRYFIVCMLIGFIVGCYSSIFVASPIWYDLHNKE